MRKGKAKQFTKNNNKLGFKLNDENRINALNKLSTGEAQEKERRELGFRWIKKGKIKKQVHPNKLNDYLADEWLLINC